MFWPLWAAAVVFPMLALVGGARWSWDLLEAETHARVTRTIGMLHEQALRAFETQDALLTAMQRFSEGMSWADIAASPAVADFLRRLDSSTPGTNVLGMVDPGGRIVQFTSTPFPPPPIDVSDRDYFRAQQGASAGRFVGEPILTKNRGLAVFAYSVPRLGADGRPDGGVLWATSRLDTFAGFYGSILEGPKDVVALVRDDGAVLVRHPPLSPAAGQRVPPREGQMEAARAAAAGSIGTVVTREAVSPFDGEQRLYFARRLPGLPVSIIYGLHPSGLREIWIHQVRILATVAGVGALVLLWLTWVAVRSAERESHALERARLEAERRAETEAALRQAQRLEVLGQLAAGISHDFRNMVQAVQSGTLLARKALAAGDPAKADALLSMVSDAAGRGATLTERMLDVTRRSVSGEEAPPVADPTATVNAIVDLLNRTLGRNVAVQVVTPGAPGALPALVRGKQAELEAALLNLVVNARDAMPQGGSICISLGTEEVAEGAADLKPGRYLRIAVTDTGIGMDAATLRRATEVFFTTKPPGQGTGLGLASARAFAEGAGGRLDLSSPGPGRGTTVTLWLPEAPATASPAVPADGAFSEPAAPCVTA